MKTRAYYNGLPVKIFYTPFPEQVRGKVKGMCSPGNNCYLIVIDSTRTQKQQQETLGHELAHIFLGHYSRTETPLPILENEAARNAEKYYRLFAAGRLQDSKCQS